MSSFPVRTFIWQTGVALHRRRLREEFIAWATRFSRIGRDNIGQRQIDRTLLGLGSCAEFYYNERDNTTGKQIVGGDAEYLRSTEVDLAGYTGSGAYELFWSVTGQIYNATTWFVFAYPYLGSDAFPGDFAVASSPYGVSYDTITNYLSQNTDVTLSGSAVVLLDENQPLRAGVMCGTSRAGSFNAEYVRMSVHKINNMS